MLNINELKKYLENVAYNITSYDNYIIYYDSQNDKILKNDDVDKIKTMYTNIFNKSLVPLLTNIDYLKIKLSVHQIIYRFKENYLTIEKLNVIGITPNGEFVAISPECQHYRDTIRILFYETCHIVQHLKSKNKYIPLSFPNEIDYMHPNESPLLKTKAFRIIKDLYKEKSRYNHVYHKSFTHNDVIPYHTRNEFLLTKWKNITKLKEYMNLNKLTYHEILFFRNLIKDLNEKSFIKILEWYKVYRKTHFDLKFTTPDIIYNYAKDKLNLDTDSKQFIIDMYEMAYDIKKKLDVNFKTLNGLIKYHNSVLEEYHTKILSKKLDKTEYKLKEKWKELDDKLKNTLKINPLNSEYKLQKEGMYMKHCVGGYTKSVKTGKSYIFSIYYEDKPYTCELTMKKDIININQLYGRFNTIAPDALYKLIGDTIKQSQERIMKDETII